MPPPPIPDWILFSPAILICGIIATVIAVSWAADRAGAPVPRPARTRPAFRPSIIQGGRADAAVPGQPDTDKLAG